MVDFDMDAIFLDRNKRVRFRNMKNKTKVNFVLLSKSGPTRRVIRTGSSGPEEDL